MSAAVTLISWNGVYYKAAVGLNKGNSRTKRRCGMNAIALTETNNRIALMTKTAEDIMTINPLSLRDDATVAEAIVFLTTRGFGGAPVINDAGKPVGFVGKTDLLRQAVQSPNKSVCGSHDGAELMSPVAAGRRRTLRNCPLTVGEIMKPALVVVPRNASLAQVIKKMLSRRVHRLFVIDKTGALIGVISSLDVLQALCD
jgi:CBS domain-containing protein